jgi:predicted MFS family arabinose efflux permease
VTDADTGTNARATRGAAAVVALSTLAIGLGASMGFLWGFLATDLRLDLGLSRAQVGILVSVFFGSTGLGSISGGVLCDRLGPRIAVTANLVVVAAASAAVCLWPTYVTLLVVSIIAGAAYSLGNAGTNVAIAAAVPVWRRGVALTVKTAGVPTLAGLGALLGPWAAARSGWIIVIGTVGAGAAIASVLSLLLLPADRPHRASVEGHAPAALPGGFYWFPIASFLLILGCSPLFTWVVPFLEESLGVSATVAGQSASAAVAGGVAGMLLFAWRSDRAGPASRIQSVASATFGVAVGVGILSLSDGRSSLGLALVGATVGFASQLGAIGVMHAAIVDVAPDAVGRASGVTMTGYYLGALLAPAAFGAFVDITRSYAAAWLTCSLVLVVAAGAFLQASRRLSRTIPGECHADEAK